MALEHAELAVQCKCGQVAVDILGPPIAVSACYCDDCRVGARQIESLPDAPALANADGASEYVMYRKDRIQVREGAAFLKPYKVREHSPTNRVVATCCNSAILMNFDDGKHWVNLYRARWHKDPPPLQVRVFTKYAAHRVETTSDIPGYSNFPLSLPLKLIVAKLQMVFSR